MKHSALLASDQEEQIALYKRMKPEERLIAYFHHSQLVHQMHQAGVRYRSRHPVNRTRHPRSR